MSLWFVGAAAAFTLAGSVVDANNQKEAGKANQQIANNNAVMAEQQGKDEQILAARESQQSTWRTRAMLGRQKAAIAASGIDMDVGTPVDVLGDTALFGEADRKAIELDAARRAWGFQGEATNYRNQGTQAAWQGKAAGSATILKGIGSAIGTVGAGYRAMKAGK